MKKVLLSLVALAAMVACNNEETVVVDSHSLITFDNSFVEVKTRVDDPSITTASIDAFDVWGFIDQPIGTVFSQEHVTKNAEKNTWEYTNLQYWLPNHHYYFYAVAPAHALAHPTVERENTAIEVNTTGMSLEGLGTIDFTNENGTLDLLYAEKIVETVTTNDPGKVSLQFMHLLSKVQFTFKNAFTNDNATLKVTGLKIVDAPKKGSVVVKGEDRTEYVWSIPQGVETTTLDFGNVNGGERFMVGEPKGSDCARLTIPAGATQRYEIKFTLELYYGDKSAGTSNKTVYLEGQEFAIGKNYNIVAEITPDNFADEALKPIEFETITVETWEDGVINGNLDFTDENGNQGGNQGGNQEPTQPVALATPVVTATVAEGKVTVAWEAVANADSYDVTFGGKTEKVTDTSYIFDAPAATNEDVVYTVTVVAKPAEGANFTASDAAEVEFTIAKDDTPSEPSEPETPAAGSAITVAKFLELADTATEYQLTGVIRNAATSSYGNFDLVDATGTIYVYGLLTPEGESQKQWAAAGLRDGDTITIKGKYNVYNNSAQIKNATYVSHLSAPFVSADPVTINAEDTTAKFAVESNIAWTVSCDAGWVTSYTTSGENNGEVAVTVEANNSTENRTASFTFSGVGIEDYVVTLTQYGAGATDTKGTYTSEEFMSGGTSNGGKYYKEKVKINGTEYDCFKLGTSSVVGDYTTDVVNESGNLTLSFYAVGWNGKTSKLNVYVDGVKVADALVLTANTGAANNTPYTITPSDDTDYYSIQLTGVTESSKIKFETVSGATRAIIFGVQLY